MWAELMTSQMWRKCKNIDFCIEISIETVSKRLKGQSIDTEPMVWWKQGVSGFSLLDKMNWF